MLSNDKHDWHVAIWWAVQRGRSAESELSIRVGLDLRDEYLTLMERYWDTELKGFEPKGFLNDNNTYTCERCGGTFEKGWTDEEAAAEAQTNFPGLKKDDEAIICDDCYKQLIAWMRTKNGT